jgi:hypothetical protein
VFLHVLADAREVELRFNAYLGEYFRITDARELENLHKVKTRSNISYATQAFT